MGWLNFDDPSSLLLAFAEQDVRMCFAMKLNNSRLIYLNPAFKDFFHLKLSDSSPERLLAMIHKDDKEYLIKRYHFLKPGKVTKDIEFRVILPGSIAYLKAGLLLTNLKHRDGILMGYIEDVSAYKEQTNKLNADSNKKNAILNILSHDLAGPLGSIQMLSSLLASKTKDFANQEVDKIIAGIGKISGQCAHMIQEFVKIEFLESAGVELVKSRCDLSSSIRNLIEGYRQAENNLNIDFRFHTTDPSLFIEIDEPKFSLAIDNLISNAIKFTRDGGTISVDLEKKKASILIKISDTGIGIPRQFHINLFEKFNAARRTGLKGEPSIGLGMSIIKTIIEWHKGEIWFESEEDKGTVFYIEIPESI